MNLKPFKFLNQMGKTLFEISDEKQLSIKGLTCNSCEHRQRWECNSKVFQYCGVRKSNRTQNGKLKIKCKDAACLLYEPITLELIFSIENVMKYFPDAEFSEGDKKRGTTSARVLQHKKFWIIESPRYEGGIKCWVPQANSRVGKEIKCKTVGDLVSALNKDLHI